ncbi:MFS transporter [Silvanigrella aquatica]|uniref:Major facilitator superfamily (MFS) profile domain-containing protein n=1 Tax=Silvanigrella aquatica TaxID=1915309 RepID=A0A1L4D2X6_9BACT|nr:MFS transporter [Silvanigrella aquatica]APJ04549.1 hypothetical protein AXG55_11790 [Silvanigrella aquatica]
MTSKKHSEFKTLSLCSLGGAFEYYDFSLFALMAPVIGQHFFNESIPSIALMKTFGIFAAGYFARFLGGFYFSHLGDTTGRKSPFMITLFLMAIPTLGIAILPTYEQIGILAPLILLLLRIAQGFALGGEAPCAMAFIHEYASKNKKCFAMGLLFGGILFGSFFASLIYTFLNTLIPKAMFDDWGWRIPFAVGGILGIIGVYLRKNLKESNEFIHCKKSNLLLKVPFLKIFQKHLSKIFIGIIFLLPSSTAFLYYLLISSKTLETEYHFDPKFIKEVTTLGFFLNAIFGIFFGYLSDKFTAKKIYILGIISLCILSSVSHFILSMGSDTIFLLFIMLLSINLGACVGSVFHILTMMFPIQIRTSSLALALNTTNGLFIGITPLLLSNIASFTNNNALPGFYILTLCLLSLVIIIKFNKKYL